MISIYLYRAHAAKRLANRQLTCMQLDPDELNVYHIDGRYLSMNSLCLGTLQAWVDEMNRQARANVQKAKRNAAKYLIQTKYVPKYDGFGLFAGKHTPAKTIVAVYFSFFKTADLATDMTNAMHYDRLSIKRKWFDLIIDGAHGPEPNACTINHTCDVAKQNVDFEWIYPNNYPNNPIAYLVAKTIRPVNEGEEFLWDYCSGSEETGHSYWLSAAEGVIASSEGQALIYCACAAPRWMPLRLCPRAFLCPLRRCKVVA